MVVDFGEILRTVVESLPPVTIGSKDYAVQFFEGILDDAKEQMNTYKENNIMPYPAVWLLRDYDESETGSVITLSNIQLILLIDTEGSYQAPERLETRIDPYLLPLKNNVIRGLMLAGVLVTSPRILRKLTFLGSANTGTTSNNSNTNSRIFSDYLDGLKVTINASFYKTLNLNCYGFR